MVAMPIMVDIRLTPSPPDEIVAAVGRVIVAGAKLETKVALVFELMTGARHGRQVGLRLGFAPMIAACRVVKDASHDASDGLKKGLVGPLEGAERAWRRRNAVAHGTWLYDGTRWALSTDEALSSVEQLDELARQLVARALSLHEAAGQWRARGGQPPPAGFPPGF